MTDAEGVAAALTRTEVLVAMPRGMSPAAGVLVGWRSGGTSCKVKFLNNGVEAFVAKKRVRLAVTS